MIEYEDDISSKSKSKSKCKSGDNNTTTTTTVTMCSSSSSFLRSLTKRWTVRQPIIRIVCNELIKQQQHHRRHHHHKLSLHFAKRSHFQWVHCNFSHLHILFSNLSCILHLLTISTIQRSLVRLPFTLHFINVARAIALCLF